LPPAPPTQLVVSTHFDDAVLSLSHLLQSAGSRATVVTVCGGAPPAGPPVSEWDEASGFVSGREAARLRAREDVCACAVTGARRVLLRHLDEPYRERPLTAGAIRSAIERLLDPGDVLWIPAAIGAHPDHVDVRTALLPLAARLPPARLRVYADLPYAGDHGHRLPRAVAEALPGLRRRDSACAGRPSSASSRPYVATRHRSPRSPRPPTWSCSPSAECSRGNASGGAQPLADPGRGVILQGVIAMDPDSRYQLAAGEAVLWRERRSPPFMEAVLAVTAILTALGVAVASPFVTPFLIAAAVGAFLIGRRFARGHYLEDQLLTDRRALVVPRLGTAYGVPLDHIASVELKGTRATFTGEGGDQFRFAFVRRHRALRKALETGAPHISLEQRWDPNCAG
jgi:LmbE family N-acetylglucosaminyl deacetylase